MTETLDLNDVQGLVVRSYSKLRAACYVMLQIDVAAAARTWLDALAAQISSGQDRSGDTAVNLALTPSGLRKLGLTSQTLSMFSNEFLEGMTSSFRSRILGDVGSSAPAEWTWGGPSTTPIDLMLMLFARDDATLATLYASHINATGSHGLKDIIRLDTVDLGDKEHFGFHDGVSQPIIPGLSRTGNPANTVQVGEFILGYHNEYGLYTDRPMINPRDDPKGLLPGDAGGSGNRDLGRNGSYVVFRQISQDVPGFWQFVQHASGGGDVAAGVRLAAKLLGRWPSGAPLVLAPDMDTPSLADANDFDYFHTDVDGIRCPLGAHIRRANPRDSLDPQPGTQASVDVGKRHRLLRRGREYGPPVTLDAEAVAQLTPTAPDRGLHFIALNANISRQFEFIQHTWLNNPKFNALYDDADPINGAHQPHGGTFTIQADPVRRQIRGLPQFVTVRGGAYFFLPGMRAIRYLASLTGAA